MEDANVTKRGGETVLTTSFRRTKGGVRLTIKAHPNVEALFQEWAQNEKLAVREYGTEWVPTNGKHLYAWATPKIERLNAGTFNFNLIEIGRRLISTESREQALRRTAGLSTDAIARGDLNFSFIRLVGISEPEGVTIELRGAYSLDYLKDLRNRIMQAGRVFYSEYLLPVDLSCHVIAQDTRL